MTSVALAGPALGRSPTSGVELPMQTVCNAQVLGARTVRNQAQHRRLRKATIRACSSAALRTRSSQISGAASPMGRSSSAWAASSRILPTRWEKRLLACGSRLSPSARLTRHAASSARAWRPCARRRAFEMVFNRNCMTVYFCGDAWGNPQNSPSFALLGAQSPARGAEEVVSSFCALARQERAMHSG